MRAGREEGNEVLHFTMGDELKALLSEKSLMASLWNGERNVIKFYDFREPKWKAPWEKQLVNGWHRSRCRAIEQGQKSRDTGFSSRTLATDGRTFKVFDEVKWDKCKWPHELTSSKTKPGVIIGYPSRMRINCHTSTKAACNRSNSKEYWVTQIKMNGLVVS